MQKRKEEFFIIKDKDGNVVSDADVELDAEGRFAFGFTDSLNAADRYSPYEIEVKVTDLTGETASSFLFSFILHTPPYRR